MPKKIFANLLLFMCLSEASHLNANTKPRMWRQNISLDPIVESQLTNRCAISLTGATDFENLDGLHPTEAYERIYWAMTECGHISQDSEKLFSHYMDDITFKWLPLPFGSMRYPTFAKNEPQKGYPVWKPSTFSCDIPSDVIWLVNCDTDSTYQEIDHLEGDPTPRQWRSPVSSPLPVETSELNRCPDQDIQNYANIDFLDYEEAQNRIEWAIDCGHIRETSRRIFTHFSMKIHSNGFHPAGSIRYPSFAINDHRKNHPRWQPNLLTCNMPSSAIWLKLCMNER